MTGNSVKLQGCGEFEKQLVRDEIGALEDELAKCKEDGIVAKEQAV